MKFYFDIETGPLPDEQLAQVMPEFKAPANYKDEAKIAAYVSEAQSAWNDKAALDALTGQVLVFTWATDDCEPVCVTWLDEAQLVRESLYLIAEQFRASVPVVGFNVKGFDLPFLVRRAWALGVQVPVGLLKNWKGRWSWNENIYDLLELWHLGARPTEGCSLKAISQRLLGMSKSDVGKNFAATFAEDRETALAYARQDVVLVKGLAEKMLA